MLKDPLEMWNTTRQYNKPLFHRAGSTEVVYKHQWTPVVWCSWNTAHNTHRQWSGLAVFLHPTKADDIKAKFCFSAVVRGFCLPSTYFVRRQTSHPSWAGQFGAYTSQLVDGVYQAKYRTNWIVHIQKCEIQKFKWIRREELALWKPQPFDV